MTIPATARKAGPLLGNGATTAFPFTFKVFAASDLRVSITTAQGVETVLALGTDYSVALNANQDTSPGGAVNYPISGAPLAAGHTLAILGDIDYDQPLDLPSGGNFSPLALENQLDRTVMQIQQLEERADRALTLPASATANPTLPLPKGDTVLGWNSTATALVNRTLAELVSGSFYADWKADTFTGDGATTMFVLAYAPGNVNVLDVSISGVTQVPETDYTLSGNRVYFTGAPPPGAVILVRYSFALVTEEAPEDWGFIFNLATDTADYGTL